MDLTGKKARMMVIDRKIRVSVILLIAVCSLYGCRHSDTQQSFVSKPAGGLPGPTNLSDSQRSEIHIGLARSLEQQGDLEKAVNVYRKILSSNPKHVMATHRLAIVNDQLGKFDQSEKLFHKLLNLKPGDPNVFCDIGYSLYLQNRWAESEMNLKQAIALKPTHRRAHNNLGLVLANLDQYEEAYNEFQLAGCKSTDAYLNLAYVLTLNENFGEAAQVYELALSKNPDSQKAQIRMQELQTLVAQLYPDEQPVEQRLDQPIEQPGRVQVAENSIRSPQQLVAQIQQPKNITTQTPEPVREFVTEQPPRNYSDPEMPRVAQNPETPEDLFFEEPRLNYSQPEFRMVLEDPLPPIDDFNEKPQRNYSQPEMHVMRDAPAPSMQEIREVIRDEFQQNNSQPEVRGLGEYPALSKNDIREVIRQEFEQNYSQPEIHMVLDDPAPSMEEIREVIRQELQQNLPQPVTTFTIQAPNPSKNVATRTPPRNYSVPVSRNRVQVVPRSRMTLGNSALRSHATSPPPRMMQAPSAARRNVRITAPKPFTPSAPPRMSRVSDAAKKTIPSSYLPYDRSRKSTKPAPMRTAFRKPTQKPRPMSAPNTKKSSPASSRKTVAETQHRSSPGIRPGSLSTRGRNRYSMMQLPNPQQFFAEKIPLKVNFWR